MVEVDSEADVGSHMHLDNEYMYNSTWTSSFSDAGSPHDRDSTGHMTTPQEKKDALAQLESELGTTGNQEDYTRLVADLNFNSLAITLAAAHIQQKKPKISIQQYIHKLRNKEQSGLDLLNGDELGPQWDRDASRSIISTCHIAFEHIREIRPSAAKLLWRMSSFDFQHIPETMLRQKTFASAKSIYNSSSETPGKSGYISPWDSNPIPSRFEDEEFEDDIQLLRKYSFISFTRNWQVFDINKAVQLAMRQWVKLNDPEEFMRVLDNAFALPDAQTKERCEQLFAHTIRALTMETRSTEAVIRQACLLTRSARYASSSDHHADAEKMEAKALWNLNTVFENHPNEQPSTLQIASDLATTYSSQKRWEEAIMLQEKVVEKTTESLGEVHLDTRDYIISLVDMYQGNAQSEKANELLEKARKISKLIAFDCDRPSDEEISMSEVSNPASDGGSLFSNGLASVTSMSSAPPDGTWPVFEIVNALFLNEDMRAILNTVAEGQLFNPERFKRNFRRIVIRCGSNLRSQSKKQDERVAGRLLQLKARDIASLVAKVAGFMPGAEISARLNDLPQETLWDRVHRGFDDSSPHDFDTAIPPPASSEDQESIGSNQDVEEAEHIGPDTSPFGEFESLKDALLESQAYQDSRLELITFVARQYTRKIRNILNPTSSTVETKLARQELQSFASEIEWLSPTDIRFSDHENLTLTDHLKALVEEALSESWDWWPLEARIPSLRDGYTRVKWQCVSSAFSKFWSPGVCRMSEIHNVHNIRSS